MKDRRAFRAAMSTADPAVQEHMQRLYNLGYRKIWDFTAMCKRLLMFRESIPEFPPKEAMGEAWGLEAS